MFNETSEEDFYDSEREDKTVEELFEKEHEHIPHVKNTEEASEMVMNIEERVDKM